jgi:hypothetical protein
MSDRKTILERRARLVAAALAGLGGCTPQCNPLVCLSVVAPDAGTPAPSGSSPSDAGAKQTLVGIARDGKAGPAILVDGEPVYVKGVDAWPKEWIGERVSVTGHVRTRQGLPEKPPPKEGGIVGPYRMIEDATYELSD